MHYLFDGHDRLLSSSPTLSLPFLISTVSLTERNKQTGLQWERSSETDYPRDPNFEAGPPSPLEDCMQALAFWFSNSRQGGVNFFQTSEWHRKLQGVCASSSLTCFSPFDFSFAILCVPERVSNLDFSMGLN